MRAELTEFCVRIGKEPFLVQGAGGNVSWKDGNKLWVKASGTRLSEAAVRDIFVPVDLEHLKSEIKNNNFSVVPKPLEDAKLRPSIETLLHALLPHKVVVHLHAVDILAYLVRENGCNEISKKLADAINFITVDYFKPGEELAKEISRELSKNPEAYVVFLKNHGVVIGGNSVSGVEKNLAILTRNLATPAPKGDIQQLALDNRLFELVKSSWALFPDHVVFLGGKAICYDKQPETVPEHELYFVRGQGVITKDSFTQAKHEQLRCYYDVLVRQPQNVKLRTLNENEVSALLNWEAEHYRKNIGNC